RRGNLTARLEVLEEIEQNSVTTLHFLLDAIREIDDPKVLHSLGRALADERPVPGSGVPFGAEPARRLADLAVDAFVPRLQLPVSFPLKPAERYDPKEVEEVKTRLTRSLPQ